MNKPFTIASLCIIMSTFIACGGSNNNTVHTVELASSSISSSSTPANVNEGLETFTSLSNENYLEISEIGNCGDTPSENSSNIILVDANTPINGDVWSHIDENATAWDGVVKTAADYTITRESNGLDADCNDAPTYNSILVKKYGDWDQQHGNGYFATPAENSTFSQLDTLIFDVYYDALNSSIPTQEAIELAFDDLTSEQYEEWDNGMFTLEIQLTDTTGDYHAALNLNLPVEYANKWLRVEIPVEFMETWRTSGYDKFDATFSDLSDKIFEKIGLVAETKNRLVYRNYNQDGFDVDSTSKLFKEIAIRVKRLEVSTK